MAGGQTHATHVDLGDPQLSERISAGIAAVEELLPTIDLVVQQFPVQIPDPQKS